MRRTVSCDGGMYSCVPGQHTNTVDSHTRLSRWRPTSIAAVARVPVRPEQHNTNDNAQRDACIFYANCAVHAHVFPRQRLRRLRVGGGRNEICYAPKLLSVCVYVCVFAAGLSHNLHRTSDRDEIALCRTQNFVSRICGAEFCYARGLSRGTACLSAASVSCLHDVDWGLNAMEELICTRSLRILSHAHKEECVRNGSILYTNFICCDT